MPVILQRGDYAVWLDPDLQKVDILQALLRPCAAKPMTAYPVSLRVNNPSNDSAECVEPLAEP
jgi:putative SOS response-associated peptidase YedK